MIARGTRAVVILPCHLRGQEVVPSRLHVDPADVDSLTSSDARALATALLAAADDIERLDAAALPHLDAFLAAVESFDS